MTIIHIKIAAGCAIVIAINTQSRAPIIGPAKFELAADAVELLAI